MSLGPPSNLTQSTLACQREGPISYIDRSCTLHTEGWNNKTARIGSHVQPFSAVSDTTGASLDRVAVFRKVRGLFGVLPTPSHPITGGPAPGVSNVGLRISSVRLRSIRHQVEIGYRDPHAELDSDIREESPDRASRSSICLEAARR